MTVPPISDSVASNLLSGGEQTSWSISDYQTGGFVDELVSESGHAHPDAAPFLDLISRLPISELWRRQQTIERSLFRMGVTFTVYGDSGGTERIMPFDIVPRIISSVSWSHIEAGLKQRIAALNCFLTDVYGSQDIVNEGIIPRELIETAAGYRKECQGLRPFHDVWCHITGTDLVRSGDGAIYVLEDNLRCPSGASYVMQNRMMMKQNFPQVFSQSRVRPVNDYPARMYNLLRDMAPPMVDDPVVAVLTPGVFNSAYYEHSFFAQQMGVELVEGRDLVVDNDDVLQMKTVHGLQRVDVLYRRIDDDFLDPEVFRSDSMLGVPGLMRAFRSGHLALANAPGTGVADDKVIYAYVPKMIEFYLGESAVLPNVPTYVCHNDDDRKYVLDHLDELVVKAANESGGYGLMIGPHASDEQRAEFGAQIRENPRNYVAQPTLSLSRTPTLIENDGNATIEGRHVDLRPYILCGKDEVYVLPGGLTRVALRKGSLVVNSSQGGGSKDTLVMAQVGQEAVLPR